MRRFVRGIAAICVALLLSCPAGAAAQDEGVIVQSSCSMVQSGDYVLVYCFAQVHNQSDQIICLNQGSYMLEDGDGPLYSDTVSQMWPYFLKPGEDGFFFDIVPFEPDENGVRFPSITGIQYDVEYMTVEPQYAGYALNCAPRIERDPADGGLYVVCEIGNPTQMDAYAPSVAFGLYAEGGVLLYADGVTLQNVGIPAGGTVLARFYVEDVFVTQWESYGASPAQVRASATFRNDSD